MCMINSCSCINICFKSSFLFTSWDIGEWSECSKTCGLGMQHRQILCRHIYANRTHTVQPHRCQNLEKPETTSTCQLKICSEWQIRTDWTPVSGRCKGSNYFKLHHFLCITVGTRLMQVYTYSIYINSITTHIYIHWKPLLRNVETVSLITPY